MYRHPHRPLYHLSFPVFPSITAHINASNIQLTNSPLSPPTSTISNNKSKGNRPSSGWFSLRFYMNPCLNQWINQTRGSCPQHSTRCQHNWLLFLGRKISGCFTIHILRWWDGVTGMEGIGLQLLWINYRQEHVLVSSLDTGYSHW